MTICQNVCNCSNKHMTHILIMFPRNGGKKTPLDWHPSVTNTGLSIDVVGWIGSTGLKELKIALRVDISSE